MKTKYLALSFLVCLLANSIYSQPVLHKHSILPMDGVIPYFSPDTSRLNDFALLSSGTIKFKPTVNFFFRPETTSHYKEAGVQEDTGHLNFYLRADVGAKISLPKNIDMVFNLQSYGLYTRSFGPLDKNMSLYEAYLDMKQLDRAGNLSLRFGRASLGKYGSEMLVGDDDFLAGRSFETLRFRYKNAKTRSDWMWVQLYQQAPDTADFDWNHPIFLGSFNTFNFSDGFNLDLNLPYIIDQYFAGYRTRVYMPNVRVFGQSNALKYTAEVIYQGGNGLAIVGDEVLAKIKSYAFEASAGYFTDDNKMEVDLAYYRASGDDNLADDEIKTYNVLWQNEHRRFGFIDAFKGSNVQAGTLHLNWSLSDMVGMGVHGVYATVLEQKDRSPAFATIPSLNNLSTDSKVIRYGGDWYLNYCYNDFFNLQFSISAFSPGEYFTAVNGIDKLMIRAYLLLAVRV